MKIGIDISQLAYERTGVANYLRELVKYLLESDKENEYILFFSSMRRKLDISNFDFLKDAENTKIQIKTFRFPPSLLNLLWNKLHILPIEDLIGNVDIFITSDWTEPPVRKAKKVSILYDLIVYKYPEETHNQTELSLKNLILKQNIVKTQREKHNWMKKEASKIFCISEATKRDAIAILGIEESKLKVIYPGI